MNGWDFFGFLGSLGDWKGPLNVNWRDLLDILLLSLLLYRVILFIKGTRSLQILLGIVLLLIFYFLSDLLQLHALYRVLNLFFGSLVVILVVLFQTDIRKVLVSLVRRKFSIRRSKLKDPYFYDRLLRAIEHCSYNNIGMLVALEQNNSIRGYAESGTVLDARISAPLLVSLFNTGSPLHDGAVLIDRNLRLHAAACILPLTSRINLTTKTGTRHRAAIGLTEESDCLVIVVSEETGRVSFFREGKQEIVPLAEFKEKIDTYLFQPAAK